jgi:hypothetical protein
MKGATARRRTVNFAELSTLRMVSGTERRIKKVISQNKVMEWVGIGWVDCGPPTRSQRRRLRHVIS